MWRQPRCLGDQRGVLGAARALVPAAPSSSEQDVSWCAGHPNGVGCMASWPAVHWQSRRAPKGLHPVMQLLPHAVLCMWAHAAAAQLCARRLQRTKDMFRRGPGEGVSTEHVVK